MHVSGNSSPSRKRDSYFGSQDQTTFGHTIRGSFSRPRPKSFLEDDTEGRGFHSAINGFDMDPSRRQDARPSTSEYGRLRAVGDGPSREPSMPPSRGTNESPAFQERFPFQGHTPSNSMGLSRASLAQSLSYTVGASTHTLDTSAMYDFAASRQQAASDTPSLPNIQGLSLEERRNSGGSGVPFNSLSQSFNPQLAGQGWPAEATAQARYMSELAGMDGSANSSEAQYVPSKRGSIAEHVSPKFAGSSQQYTPPPETWAPRPSSRDLRLPQETERRTTPNTAATTFVPQGGSQGLAQTLPQTIPPGFPQGAPQGPSQGLPQGAHAFYPGMYFNPSFPGNFHPSLYDPYAQANYRGTVLPNYPLSLHPYIASGAGIALRAGRDQDPGRGMRSALLEDFRANSKSSKRYDLKVRSRAFPSTHMLTTRY